MTMTMTMEVTKPRTPYAQPAPKYMVIVSTRFPPDDVMLMRGRANDTASGDYHDGSYGERVSYSFIPPLTYEPTMDCRVSQKRTSKCGDR